MCITLTMRGSKRMRCCHCVTCVLASAHACARLRTQGCCVDVVEEVKMMSAVVYIFVAVALGLVVAQDPAGGWYVSFFSPLTELCESSSQHPLQVGLCCCNLSQGN